MTYAMPVILRSLAAALFSSVVLVGLTYACFRLGFDLTTTALVDLMSIVLVALTGNIASSVAACVAATLSLNYWLVAPAYALTWDRPLDLAALLAFLTTALVITHLLSRVRQSLGEAQAARDELRLAIDTIPALVWTTLPDGSGGFNNQRWLEYTGLSRDQATDWGYRAALHPEDYQRLLPDWTAKFAAGQAIADEVRLRRFDGVYRWFMHRAVPLRDALGSIVKWYGTSTDIEDERRAVEKLREQARLLDLTHDSVFVRDVHDVITYWNRGAEERYGWTRDEVLGQSTHSLLQTVFPQPFEEITATLLETGRWEGELVHTRRDGTRVVVASRWSLQRDEQGRCVGTLETNNDITERKRAEAALRQSEAYLAEAQRLSRTGSFAWDVAGGTLIWSQEMYRIFEYDPATTTPMTLDQALARVHPDDLAKTVQLVERVVQEQMDWEFDYRLLLPDGSVKYVHSVSHATQNEEGNLKYVGAIMDVTAARRAEAELRRSEAYLAEAHRLSQTGSWARNVRHPEQGYASAEVYRIFGLAPGDPAVGTLELRDVVHPDDLPRLEQRVQAALRDRTDYETECRIVRPDGETRYLYMVGHPVVDTSGEVVEVVGTVMDVTERKRADRALRRARERALKARFQAVLDERIRLAREIHDTLLQGFTGVALKLVAATRRFTGSAEIAALQDVVSLAQKTLVDARRAVWDLRSPSLVGGELVTELRGLAEDSVRGVGLQLDFEVTGTPRSVAPEVQAVAGRVVQEAVTNVVKHAAAHAARVRLSFGARALRLSVKDDGRGFAAEVNLEGYGGHWGLLGMRERAAQVQGKLSVRSAPGQGTELVLLVPYATRSDSPRTPAGDPSA